MISEKKIAAIRQFYYDNNASPFPPVLSDLSMLSQILANVSFDFSVKVTDGNGASDIKKVYYRLFKPDGTQQQESNGNKEFELYDDGSAITYTGNVTSHDGIVGDGRYTTHLLFPANAAKGNWRFEFEAIDRAGIKSVIITKIVELQ